MKSKSLQSSALLIIDMQRYFLESKAPAFLDPPDELIPNVIKLVGAFREAKRPIIFTRHAHKKGGSTGQMGNWWGDELPYEGDKFSELVKGLPVEEADIILTKTKYSAFEETELDIALKREGIDTVVICGVMTNLCVETTARHAFMKDFNVIIIDDACATKSEDYHRASILNLSYGFAHIEKTKEIIEKLQAVTKG